jgi:hypothetical protein
MDKVIKDTHFTLVMEIQRPDAKKRLSIGQAMEEPAAAYNIYRNSLGQIVLDPVKGTPVYEAWLFENKDAWVRTVNAYGRPTHKTTLRVPTESSSIMVPTREWARDTSPF